MFVFVVFLESDTRKEKKKEKFNRIKAYFLRQLTSNENVLFIPILNLISLLLSLPLLLSPTLNDLKEEKPEDEKKR